MTEAEYWIEVSLVHNKNQQWRYGQTLFNTLLDNRPDLAERIRGGALDPFYCEDTTPRIKAFAQFIQENW